MQCMTWPLEYASEGEGCKMGQCGPGLACLQQSLVPYCTQAALDSGKPGCCASYCDLQAPDCPPGSACTTLMDPNLGLPEYARLGVCSGP